MKLSEAFKPYPRYVTWAGDDVHAPLWRSLHKSTSVKVVGLMAAFNAVALFTQNDLGLMENTLRMSAILGGYVGGDLFQRAMFYGLRMQTMDKGDVCIDRAPDEKTPRSNPYYIDAAKTIMKEYLTLVFPTVLMAIAVNRGEHSYLHNLAILFEQGLVHPKGQPYWLSGVAGGLLTVYVRAAGDNMRLYRVFRERYAVVQTPPPEKKPEKALNPMPAPLRA
jgi:hypothetical protein